MEHKKDSKLTPKELALLAIASSVAGNCLKSLRLHFLEAMEQGCSLEEIEEAIEIARSVKQRPLNDIYEVAINLLSYNRAKISKRVKTD